MKNIWVSSANVQTFLDYNPPISSIKGFGSIPSLVRNPPEKLLWIQLKFYAYSLLFTKKKLNAKYDVTH